MKSVIATLSLLFLAQVTRAHGVPATITNYTKVITTTTDYVIHTVGYPDTDFDNLIGVSSIQDLTRKIRVLKYSFSVGNCGKDVEVYTKLDGSAVLSHKVVGCAL
jgi:hypothetical protein